MLKPTVLGRFIAASGLTNLSDGIALVAWGWVASTLTRDPLLIALLPVALRLPWFMCAIPAGLVTDRTSRKRLILFCDGLRCLAFAGASLVMSLSLPLAEAPESGISSPALFAALAALALVVGAAEVFRDNAAQTILPSIVDHEALEGANGRLWSVELIGNALLGPSLGAFLISVSLPIPFAFNALMFALALTLMAAVRVPPRPAQTVVRNWRREISAGFSFLKGAPMLRLLALITGVWNLLHQMVVIALVLHVQENLHLGVQAYGVILAAGAIGGILGGLTARRIVQQIGRVAAAQWALLVSALAFVAMPFAPGAIGLAMVLICFEFAGLVWNSVSVAYRQRMIPDGLLGRVNSLYRLLAWGMMPVGLVLSGLIVNAAARVLPRDIALTAPFFAAGAGAMVLTFMAWRRLRAGFDV